MISTPVDSLLQYFASTLLEQKYKHKELRAHVIKTFRRLWLMRSFRVSARRVGYDGNNVLHHHCS